MIEAGLLGLAGLLAVALLGYAMQQRPPEKRGGHSFDPGSPMPLERFLDGDSAGEGGADGGD